LHPGGGREDGGSDGRNWAGRHRDRVAYARQTVEGGKKS
jgi:hypothetical protein